MIRVPRCFDGETVVLIGSGPSLTDDDCDYTEGKACRVIGTNDAYRMAPWLDVLYAADHGWWQQHIRYVEAACACQLWTQSAVAREQYELNWVILTQEPGLSDDPQTIHSGGHSGYQAMNLAYLMGAKRILLLGYDCQRTEGKDHWFGSHIGGLTTAMDVKDWAKAYDSTVDQLRLNGVDVINCSRDSAITCFPRAPIEAVL